MTLPELVPHKIISLKNHPALDERWLHERLKENPSLLGLGDLDVRDSERRQPSGGRLDLLLQDIENLKRYEVEIQLGAMDESHIIRAIEYWDAAHTHIVYRNQDGREVKTTIERHFTIYIDGSKRVTIVGEDATMAHEAEIALERNQTGMERLI